MVFESACVRDGNADDLSFTYRRAPIRGDRSGRARKNPWGQAGRLCDRIRVAVSTSCRLQRSDAIPVQGPDDGNGEIVDIVHPARPAFWSISLFLAVQSEILGNIKGYALFTFIQCVEIS